MKIGRRLYLVRSLILVCCCSAISFTYDVIREIKEGSPVDGQAFTCQGLDRVMKVQQSSKVRLREIKSKSYFSCSSHST